MVIMATFLYKSPLLNTITLSFGIYILSRCRSQQTSQLKISYCLLYWYILNVCLDKLLHHYQKMPLSFEYPTAVQRYHSRHQLSRSSTPPWYPTVPQMNVNNLLNQTREYVLYNKLSHEYSNRRWIQHPRTNFTGLTFSNASTS